MPPVEGCAACGRSTASKPVSPYEAISAIYCGECQYVVAKLNELVDAGTESTLGDLQVNTVRRLRRVEQVAHELVRRRMVSALMARATWDDVSEALGMPADEAKRTYPISDTPDSNWGWGWTRQGRQIWPATAARRGSPSARCGWVVDVECGRTPGR